MECFGRKFDFLSVVRFKPICIFYGNCIALSKIHLYLNNVCYIEAVFGW